MTAPSHDAERRLAKRLTLATPSERRSTLSLTMADHSEARRAATPPPPAPAPSLASGPYGRRCGLTRELNPGWMGRTHNQWPRAALTTSSWRLPLYRVPKRDARRQSA